MSNVDSEIQDIKATLRLHAEKLEAVTMKVCTDSKALEYIKENQDALAKQQRAQYEEMKAMINDLIKKITDKNSIELKEAMKWFLGIVTSLAVGYVLARWK